MPRPTCNNPSCGAVAANDEARFCARCGAALVRHIDPRLPPNARVHGPPHPTAPPTLRAVAWNAPPPPGARPRFEDCTLVTRADPSARTHRRGTGVPVEFASVAMVIALILALVAMVNGEASRTAFRTVRAIAPPSALTSLHAQPR